MAAFNSCTQILRPEIPAPPPHFYFYKQREVPKVLDEILANLEKNRRNLTIKEKALLDMLESVRQRDEEAKKAGRDSFKRPLE